MGRDRARPPSEDFRGRGPRGYTRSDDRIREDVCEALTDDPLVDPSDVEVRVQDGEVTLEGTVRRRWDKRRIEDIVDAVLGVRDVHNHLRRRVADEPAREAELGPRTPRSPVPEAK